MKTDNKKGYKVFQPLLLGLSMAIGMILGVKMNDTERRNHWVQQIDDQIAPIGRVEEILRYIDAKHIDSLDQDHLIKVATSAIIDELDPYSAYIASNSAETIEKSLNGYSDGIGIEEFEYDDKFFVYKVYESSSASEKGIKKGDHIIAFNDVLLGNKKAIETKNDWFKNASIGSECKLTIARNFGKDTLVFSLAKNYGSFHNITPGLMLDDQTAYIKIDQFSKDSYRRFMDHFELLNNKKIFKNLIIDLRGNTGGYVQESINTVNQFFQEKGKLLLTTINKNKKETKYRTTGRSFFSIDKIVVLIDEQTASSSEIFSSVIQDYDKGTIIGQPSFGKGLVQEYFPLINGDKIKLSTARYITPAGRIIFKDSTKVNKLKYKKDTKSKRLKLPLKSGKIIPEILVNKSPLEQLNMHNYIDAILDSYIFFKLSSDSGFKEHFETHIDSKSDILVSELHHEIKEYFDLGRSMTIEENNELLSIANANYIKHTVNNDAYRSFLNNSDNYIKSALAHINRK